MHLPQYHQYHCMLTSFTKEDTTSLLSHACQNLLRNLIERQQPEKPSLYLQTGLSAKHLNWATGKCQCHNTQTHAHTMTVRLLWGREISQNVKTKCNVYL